MLGQNVNEVRQSEEWEAVEMNIFEMGKELGIEQGKALGLEEGKKESLRILVRSVESSMKNFHINLQEACRGLEVSVEEYEEAKRQIAR